MATKYLNLDLDTTLGGNSPSDVLVPSQKAIKTYVDGKTGSNNPNLSLWSTNFTNCVTEVPQNITLTLSNGTLTLKAGSTYYTPSGTATTTTSDKTTTYNAIGTRFVCMNLSTGNMFVGSTISETCSGSSDSLVGTPWHMWFDTSNNLINRFGVDGTTAAYNASLPIAIVTVSGDSITSIDQVFNGFGYIGSTIFCLPNVKVSAPYGRNEDGTLKSNHWTSSTVITRTQTTNGTYMVTINTTNGTFGLGTHSYTYNEVENLIYYDGVLSDLRCVVGKLVVNSNKVSSFTPKTVAHVLDYSDLDTSTIDTSDSVIRVQGTTNKNTSSSTSTIYDWVGTSSQYTTQNIATNHPDWVCFITDDSTTDTTYTKGESDALFVRKTGNYDEDITGLKNFTSNIQVKDELLTPSTNTTKSSTIEDSILATPRNTSGKIDGPGIVRAQKTNGDREVWYRAGFRKSDDSGNVWPALQVGVTPENYTYIRTSMSDWPITTEDTTIVNTKHLLSVLKAIYSVGSCYIGTQSSCPLAALFGTWSLVASKVIVNVDSSASITGSIGTSSVSEYGKYFVAQDTNFSQSTVPNIGGYSMTVATNQTIPGASATVSSTSLTVNIWKRTA